MMSMRAWEISRECAGKAPKRKLSEILAEIVVILLGLSSVLGCIIVLLEHAEKFPAP